MLVKLYEPDGSSRWVKVTWSSPEGFEDNLVLLLDTDEELDGLVPIQRAALASLLIMECDDE